MPPRIRCHRRAIAATTTVSPYLRGHHLLTPVWTQPQVTARLPVVDECQKAYVFHLPVPFVPRLMDYFPFTVAGFIASHRLLIWDLFPFGVMIPNVDIDDAVTGAFQFLQYLYAVTGGTTTQSHDLNSRTPVGHRAVKNIWHGIIVRCARNLQLTHFVRGFSVCTSSNSLSLRSAKNSMRLFSLGSQPQDKELFTLIFVLSVCFQICSRTRSALNAAMTPNLLDCSTAESIWCCPSNSA